MMLLEQYWQDSSGNFQNGKGDIYLDQTELIEISWSLFCSELW